MKNIFMHFVLIVFMAALLPSCEVKEKPSTPPPGAPINIKDFKGMIDPKTAIALSKAYAADNAKSLVYVDNKVTTEKDARSIWFSLNDLKKYVAYIEQQARKSGCTNIDNFGLRLYYGKYPSKEEIAANANLKGLENYASRHTIFFSPTFYDKKTNTNIDINPTQVSRDCGFNLANNENTKPQTKQMGILLFAPTPPPAEEDNYLLNHGTLKPPPDEEEGTYPIEN